MQGWPSTLIRSLTATGTPSRSAGLAAPARRIGRLCAAPTRRRHPRSDTRSARRPSPRSRPAPPASLDRRKGLRPQALRRLNHRYLRNFRKVPAPNSSFPTPSSGLGVFHNLGRLELEPVALGGISQEPLAVHRRHHHVFAEHVDQRLPVCVGSIPANPALRSTP